MNRMRLLLIGDIVGKPGRSIVTRSLSAIAKEYQLDFVIANAENSSGGSGVTPLIYNQLIASGVNAITLGDHIYRRKEIVSVLESETNIVKPANLSPESPGKEFAVVESATGIKVGVLSLLGRVFMKPIDCPFLAADRVLKQLPEDVKVIVLDYHAEATSDMQLMGRYLDGRVSAVLGTHTHVATADEQIFPGGTAFQCDVGMTGPYESILGRKIDRVMKTTLTNYPTPFDVAKEDVRISGTIVDIDAETGHAVKIERLSVRQDEADRLLAKFAN